MKKYNFKKEFTDDECDKFVNTYYNELSLYVKFLRGEAYLIGKDGEKIAVKNPVPEQEKTEELDVSCTGAVLWMISKLTSNLSVEANYLTVYKLSEFLRIAMTLNKFVEIGIMNKTENGYTIVPDKFEAFTKDMNKGSEK